MVKCCQCVYSSWRVFFWLCTFVMRELYVLYWRRWRQRCRHRPNDVPACICDCEPDAIAISRIITTSIHSVHSVNEILCYEVSNMLFVCFRLFVPFRSVDHFSFFFIHPALFTQIFLKWNFTVSKHHINIFSVCFCCHSVIVLCNMRIFSRQNNMFPRCFTVWCASNVAENMNIK